MGKPALFIAVCMAMLTADTDPVASRNAKKDARCERTVSGMGAPHRIKTIAQFNAVRAWTERSKKHGAKFGHWHNASGASIECNKPDRSDYYSCKAKASPCKAPIPEAAKKS